MIDVQDVSIVFGGTALFAGISFKMHGKDKIGLVGRNGVGKSTLLHVLAGDILPDDGEIHRQKGTKIGFLRQDIDFPTESMTLHASCLKAFKELSEKESELNTLQKNLEGDSLSIEEQLQHSSKIAELHEELALHGFYQRESKISQVLSGLGFSEEQINQDVTTFSGGWRMRIELAHILLISPEILLLDEPTNHLDIESIIWLEKFLKGYTGALIMVSHDKQFLNTVCNRTIEIQHRSLYSYTGNYDAYLSQRELLETQQIKRQKNIDSERKRLKALIDKFRYKSSKAAFAQTLIRQLEQMDDVQIDAQSTRSMQFQFTPAPHSGKVVLEAKNIVKTYGENRVLEHVNFSAVRGEKWAFIGQNGQGKTTLVKCLMNEEPYEGTVVWGHKVDVGYFSQDQSSSLDPKATVLDTLLDRCTVDMRPRARAMLGSFLFEGEDVEKPVSVLSGGERGRLALCCLLTRPYNVLILDEPTNHLDIAAKEALKNALSQYQGTLIVISHDREFLNGLTEKTFVFRSEHKKEFLGSVEEYLAQADFGNIREFEKAETSDQYSPRKQETEETSALSYQEQKARKRLKTQIKKLENAIESCEMEKKALEVTMQDQTFYALSESEQQKSFTQLTQISTRLDELNQEWETKFMEWEEEL